MGVFDLIFPQFCVVCQAEGRYICFACQQKIVRPVQLCPVCSLVSEDGWTHSWCLRQTSLDRLTTCLPYRGPVQQCLKKVKYKNSWEIIDFLCSLCVPSLEAGVVVPVPMYAAKERSRGFNQAERIAELFSRDQGLTCLPLLERRRETQPMYGLSPKERSVNVGGAFGVHGSASYPLVILVDDVWTTGATMRECARLLKQSGASQVWGVALAR